MTPLEKAEAAYADALRTPLAVTWETAARALYKVRRKAKAAPRGKGRYPCAVVEATFANGRVISMSCWSPTGKPLNWERAIRVCVSAYRFKYGAPYRRFPLEGRHTRWPPKSPERQAHEATYDAMQETDRRMRERLPRAAVPAIVSMRDKTTGEEWEGAS